MMQVAGKGSCRGGFSVPPLHADCFSFSGFGYAPPQCRYGLPRRAVRSPQ
ncbi:MAG: hypothetical protein FWD01_05060 [Defluviitaleaceae bacterium]|nr:hypothetical protein [Defluviitaleaceae bacterium]